MNSLPGAKVQWTNTRHGWHEKLGRLMAQGWVPVRTWQRRWRESVAGESLRRDAATSTSLNR